MLSRESVGGAVELPLEELHGLLFGESEGSSGAVRREAGVGIHGLVGGLLSIGMLGQEGNRRVGGSGQGLGMGLRIAGALVAHVFSCVQLLWMPPRVLQKTEKIKEVQ